MIADNLTDSGDTAWQCRIGAIPFNLMPPPMMPRSNSAPPTAIHRPPPAMP